MHLWDQVRTLRGLFLVSRTGDDPPCVDSKRFPCVDSKRLRVYIQNVPVYSGNTRTCLTTFARVAGIHGDVLNIHTEAFGIFSVPHHTAHTPRPQPQPQRHTTHHRPHHRHLMHPHTQHNTHNITRRHQTERERERKKTWKTREDKTRRRRREDKRR